MWLQGAYYPRSHPFLKDSSPSQLPSQDILVSTYTGIQGHLQESPPDQHRPIPASLTASFVDAGIVRERGLVHGGSAAEAAVLDPDEDEDAESDGGYGAAQLDQSHAAAAGGGGYIDDTSSVTSSGFGSLAANLAEARLGGAGADLDADLDMEYVIGEADAALRHALQANGLVVGGADTQGRLEDFVTDSLRTTQRFQQTQMDDLEPSPGPPKRGITADQISRAVEGAAQAAGDCVLGGRGIGPSGGRVLVAALVRHRLRVSGLLLQDNMLGDMGVEAISAVLGVCASLRTLDLSWNRIGRKGAKALASSLAAGSSDPQSGLRSLCLRGNRIGDEGVMRLADALGSGQCSLTRLDLWDESISDAGIGALAASLPRSNLKVLGLWGTPVTDGHPGSGLHDSTGLAAIAHAIPLSPQLTELNLFGNAVITPAGCQALCAAVKLGSLTGLTLSIDLPPSLAEALRKALDANSAKQVQASELGGIDEEIVSSISIRSCL